MNVNLDGFDPSVLLLVVPLVVIHFGLLIFAVVDLLRDDRRGPRREQGHLGPDHRLRQRVRADHLLPVRPGRGRRRSRRRPGRGRCRAGAARTTRRSSSGRRPVSRRRADPADTAAPAAAPTAMPRRVTMRSARGGPAGRPPPRRARRDHGRGPAQAVPGRRRSRSTASRWSCPRGRCSACWAPTAPARPPASGSSPASRGPPRAGPIVNGTVVAADALAVRRRLGYLEQDPRAYRWMTGREQLAMLGRLHGLGGDALYRAVADALERVDLADAADRRTGTYSGGMRQRLGIAGALVHRPPVIVLDEPVSALDPEGRRDVLELIAVAPRRDHRPVLDPRPRRRRADLRPGRDPGPRPAGGRGLAGGAAGPLRAPRLPRRGRARTGGRARGAGGAAPGGRLGDRRGRGARAADRRGRGPGAGGARAPAGHHRGGRERHLGRPRETHAGGRVPAAHRRSSGRWRRERLRRAPAQGAPRGVADPAAAGRGAPVPGRGHHLAAHRALPQRDPGGRARRPAARGAARSPRP